MRYQVDVMKFNTSCKTFCSKVTEYIALKYHRQTQNTDKYSISFEK